jgi:hypothetical protein
MLYLPLAVPIIPKLGCEELQLTKGSSPVYQWRRWSARWQGRDVIPSSGRDLGGSVCNKPSGSGWQLAPCKYQCLEREGGHFLQPHGKQDVLMNTEVILELLLAIQSATSDHKCYPHNETNTTAYINRAKMPSFQTSPLRSMWTWVKSTIYRHRINLLIKLSTRAEVRGSQDMAEQGQEDLSKCWYQRFTLSLTGTLVSTNTAQNTTMTFSSPSHNDSSIYMN